MQLGGWWYVFVHYKPRFFCCWLAQEVTAGCAKEYLMGKSLHFAKFIRGIGILEGVWHSVVDLDKGVCLASNI
jgi:hypothetical protein